MVLGGHGTFGGPTRMSPPGDSKPATEGRKSRVQYRPLEFNLLMPDNRCCQGLFWSLLWSYCFGAVFLTGINRIAIMPNMVENYVADLCIHALMPKLTQCVRCDPGHVRINKKTHRASS